MGVLVAALVAWTLAPPAPATADEAADFALAKPWLHAGGWLVPRVYSPDLTSAVIRLAPKDRGPFPSGTATRVLEVLEKQR